MLAFYFTLTPLTHRPLSQKIDYSVDSFQNENAFSTELLSPLPLGTHVFRKLECYVYTLSSFRYCSKSVLLTWDMKSFVFTFT